MTKISPAAADRWVVSARSEAGLLTATVTLPTVELALLGIPMGFTAAEIQSWLRDLGGVAIETSRADPRPRPIPQLLHHALTGLLFSQVELWSQTNQPLPCAAVFVNAPDGIAFGWVGQARVLLLVNGEPWEPQWVIVRDDAGNQAIAAALPADAHILVTLDHWPQGEDGSHPPATVEGECGQAFARSGRAAKVADPDADTTPVAGVLSAWTMLPPTPPYEVGEAIPSTLAPDAVVPFRARTHPHLPTGQPGLAAHPGEAGLDQPSDEQSMPSTYHPSSGTFAMPQVPPHDHEPGHVTDEGIFPSPEAAAQAPFFAEGSPPPIWSPESGRPRNYRTISADPGGAQSDPPAAAPPEPVAASESSHPVGRWLSKLLGFGGRKHARAEDPSPPVGTVHTPPPPVVQSVPSISGTFATLPPLPPPDVDEPHRLPASASMPAPRRATPAAFRGESLQAAGLADILGALSASGGIRPVEGLTAVSAASSPIVPEDVPAWDPASATPPYPVLEIAPVLPDPTRPIHIDHEPVAADPTFGIPQVPKRPLPTPSGPMPRPAPSAQVPGPAAQQPTPSARMSKPPIAPRPSAPMPKPVAPTPSAQQPKPRTGRPTPPPIPTTPPEPPAEFLAEFEASLRIEPVMDPTLPSWAQPGTPAAGPPTLPPALRDLGLRLPVEQPEPPPPEDIVRVKPVLRPPTPSAPIEITAADMAALMRELQLPTRSTEMRRPLPAGAPAAPAPVQPQLSVPPEPAPPVEPEIPDGILVARPSTAAPRRSLASWPEPEAESDSPPFWLRPWVLAACVAVLFGIGWLVGHSQGPDNDVHATPVTRLLRTVGLGGARYTVNVESDPPGAWIAVDGKDVSRQTPATLELVPGEHAVTLSIPDFGSVKTTVSGQQGQKIKVSEALHGSLEVTALDPSVPVKMSVDGEPKGWLPVHIDKLPPGLHELQFSGPNMQPWGQNVNVAIRQTTEIVAKPMTSPATGVVNVQASLNDDNGTAPLSGASVFVDGELRGTTPVTMQLPRGPHSLRVMYRNESAAVQVIDLPGGNQRFASFQFGLDSDLPPLKLQGSYAVMSRERATTVTAGLEGLDPRDVRDAWMHVRTADGLWRRFDMVVKAGPNGTLLTAPFPPDLFDSQGRATWYLSASTGQGDEFFTEMQRSAR